MKKKIDAQETQEALLNIETNGFDIDAELNNGSKDYDADFIRKHVEKLTV